MATAIDRIGHKHGRLLVYDRADNDIHNHIRWKCICDCGTYITVASMSLANGSTRSCGCMRRETTSLSGKRNLGRGSSEGAIYRNFIIYQTAAKARNYKWLLSIEQFSYIIHQNCHYCGCEPSKQISKHNNHKMNGIDRKNSKIGYVIDNCLPCCKTCNYAKNNTTYDDYMAYLDRLVIFRKGLNI